MTTGWNVLQATAAIEMATTRNAIVSAVACNRESQKPKGECLRYAGSRLRALDGDAAAAISLNGRRRP